MKQRSETRITEKQNLKNWKSATMERLSLNCSFFCLLLVRGDFSSFFDWALMQLLESAKLRFPVDFVIWHFVCAAQVGSPHPQKGWEVGPKRNIGCKTGGEVLILFWPTSTSPLRWEWQWTNVKWNGIVNVECLHWLLSWKVVQENLQPLKLTNSLEQNWKFQNEVCWFQKPLLYSKKHLREKN